MSTHTCTDCHHQIPAGQAVIRSISFARVHFCQDCAQDRGIVLPSKQDAEHADLLRWVS